MLFPVIFALLTISDSQAAPPTFSIDDLAKILREKSPSTVDVALPLLPREFRRDAVLMQRSRSLQSGSPDAPRAILSNEDGSFVLAFNGDGAKDARFEMIQFHRDTRRFEFADVEFFGNRPPEMHRDLDGCAGCHGSNEDAHPVWESFNQWPGAYGEQDEKIERYVESPAFRAFLKAAPKDPRYHSLVDLPKTHGTLNREGRLAGRPNANLLRKLMRVNFERIVDRVVRGEGYAPNRYAMLASLFCVKEPGFAKDFLAGLAGVPDELMSLEENASAYGGSAIAFYWQLGKRGYSPYSWTLSLGDSMNVNAARMPDPNAEYGTATQELARAFAARDPKIAALVGKDGRRTPLCAVLRARVKGSD